MTQQGFRQASARAVTGRAETYNGDWHALFDTAGIAQGPFNGRLLTWLNAKMSSAYANLPEAMQAFASSQGIYNWSSMGAFDAGGVSYTVTIASGTVGSNLTDFVTLVDLSLMPASFWSSVKSDGGDIRAKAMDWSVIPHDLCLFDHDGQTGVLMVKHSLLAASDNQFRITCGDAALSQLPATNPNGRNAVWSDYHRVFLFDGTVTDRCGSGHDLTFTNITAGAIPGFAALNGSNSLMKGTSLSSFTSWTMGASFKMAATSGANQDILSYTQSGSGTSAVRETILFHGINDKMSMWNSTDGHLQPSGTSSANVLYRVTGTHNATTDHKLYTNGALGATQAPSAQRPTSGNALYMGTPDDGVTEMFDGQIGYAYLRSGVLTADWLAAEYESWHTPASFYSVL